jgi:hypothetical protein
MFISIGKTNLVADSFPQMAHVAGERAYGANINPSIMQPPGTGTP